MTKRKKWTVEEDRVLTDQVKRHANNISEGLRKASNYLGRSYGACVFRWYNVISKSPDAEVCFVTIGHETRSVNRKVITSPSALTTKNTSKWLNRVLSFFRKS